MTRTINHMSVCEDCWKAVGWRVENHPVKGKALPRRPHLCDECRDKRSKRRQRAGGDPPTRTIGITSNEEAIQHAADCAGVNREDLPI